MKLAVLLLLLTTNREYLFRLPREAFVFRAELTAISQGTGNSLSHNQEVGVVCMDSFSSVISLQGTKNSVVNNIVWCIDSLVHEDVQVTPVRIPGHDGLRENELQSSQLLTYHFVLEVFHQAISRRDLVVIFFSIIIFIIISNLE